MQGEKRESRERRRPLWVVCRAMRVVSRLAAACLFVFVFLFVSVCCCCCCLFT